MEPSLAQISLDNSIYRTPHYTPGMGASFVNGNRFDELTRRLGAQTRTRRHILSLALLAGASGGGWVRSALGQETPTSASGTEIQPQGNDDQPFAPCPGGPGHPYVWLCGSGPFGPWYPMIAPIQLTQNTGIKWHGFHSGTPRGLIAGAFTQRGQEISGYKSSGNGTELQWSLADDSSSIGGRLNLVYSAERNALEIEGELLGVRFSGVDVTRGEAPATAEAVEVAQRAALLIEEWLPAAERMDSLLALANSIGGDPIASDVGCFAAGFVLGITWSGCLLGPAGCLPAAGATSYISNKCTSSW